MIRPTYSVLLFVAIGIFQVSKGQAGIKTCPENAKQVKSHPYSSRFKTKLKGGYLLSFAFDCTDQYLILKKGNRAIDTIGGTSFGLPYQNLGFVSTDFNASFAFVHQFGGGYPGNPLYFELVNKRSGKNLIHSGAAFIGADETNNLLIYSDNDVPQKGDKFTVLDVESGKKREYMFPDEIFGEAGVCNRFKLKSITKNKVLMQYEKEGLTKSISYSR